MAVRCATGGADYLSQTLSDPIDPATTSFSIFLQARVRPETPPLGPGDAITVLYLYDSGDFGGSYLWAGVYGQGTDFSGATTPPTGIQPTESVVVETGAPADFANSVPFQIELQRWGGVGLTWNHETLTWTLFIDGVRRGFIVLNSAPSALDTFELGSGVLDVEDVRAWLGRTLTGAQFRAEQLSTTPVLTDDLILSTPLVVHTDLADDRGSHDWTANGTLSTVDGPFDAPASNTDDAVAVSLLSQSFDGSAFLIASNELRRNDGGIVTIPSTIDVRIDEEDILAVASSRGIQPLAAIAYDVDTPRLRVYEALSRRQLADFSIAGIVPVCAGGTGNTLAISPSQNTVFVVQPDGLVHEYHAISGALVRVLSVTVGATLITFLRASIAISPDGLVLYYSTGTNNATIGQWDLTSDTDAGDLVTIGTASTDDVIKCLDVSADGIFVGVGTAGLGDGRGEQYDDAGSLQQTFTPDTGISGVMGIWSDPVNHKVYLQTDDDLDDENDFIDDYNTTDFKFALDGTQTLRVRLRIGREEDGGLGENVGHLCGFSGQPCTPFIDNENPCSIKEPRIVHVLRVDVQLYHSTQLKAPLNNDPSNYGGRKQDSVVKHGTITLIASDPITGQWPAQQHSGITHNDTSHFWRALRGLSLGSFMKAEHWVYLIDDALNRAAGVMRLLFQGLIDRSPLLQDLTQGFTVNDEIGDAYKLHTLDVQIPQRKLNDIPDDFAGFDIPVDTIIGVPIGLGDSDEDPDTWPTGQTAPLGKVPVIDLKQPTWAGGKFVGLVYGHAVKDGVINAYTNPTDPDDDSTALITTWGTDLWGPGQAGWSSVNPDGADLFTVINGKRYLFLFSDIDFADRPIWVNTLGPDRQADGLGEEITDGDEKRKWLDLNWIYATPGYLTGAWLPSSTFEFYPAPGHPNICRVKTSSYDVAAEVAQTYLPGGFRLNGTIGVGGAQQDRREVMAQLNVSGWLRQAWSGTSQVKVVRLDRRRSTVTKPTITSVRDILSQPRFVADEKPEWLTTNLTIFYNFNPRSGQYDGKIEGGSDNPSFLKYGSVPKTINLPFVTDFDTAVAIGIQMRDFMSMLPQQSPWGRTYCGLEDEVLDRRPITHYGANGQTGCTDEMFVIDEQTIDLDGGRVIAKGTDIEALMDTAGLNPVLLSITIEGTTPGVGFDSQFTATGHYSNGADADITNTGIPWASSDETNATVSPSGVVHGVSTGAATITANLAGVTGSKAITIAVTSPTLTAVEVTGVAPVVGGTRQLTALARYSDTTSKDVTLLATWASDDAGVVTVADS